MKEMKVIRPDLPQFFFSAKEKQAIKEAIIRAEKNTSGEIRVHVARSIQNDLMDEAKETFEKIGMANTKLRNAVLIYFAIKDRRFAILGDKGIHEKMGENLWNNIAAEMQECFMKNDFTCGIERAVEKIGEVLKRDFPYQSDDVNELSDELSFGG